MGKTKNKKRRRGLPRTTRKAKNQSKFIKPRQQDQDVKKKWDVTKQPEANFAKLGYLGKIPKKGLGERNDTELIDLRQLNQIVDARPSHRQKKYGNTQHREYMKKLVERYGQDYLAMRRDIKLNYMQYTERQLQKFWKKYTEEEKQGDASTHGAPSSNHNGAMKS